MSWVLRLLEVGSGRKGVSSTVDTVDSVDTCRYVVMSLCRYRRYASSCVVMSSPQQRDVSSLSPRVVMSSLSLCLHAIIVVIVVTVVMRRHVSSRVVMCRYVSLSSSLSSCRYCRYCPCSRCIMMPSFMPCCVPSLIVCH